jgi:hypothetical protein
MESRLHNKKEHLRFCLTFAVLLALTMSAPLFSDKIFLKSGESSIGKALGVSGTHVEWQENGILRKIPLAEVQKIDVGYDGVPVCVEFSGVTTLNCDLLLHRLTKTSASFTSNETPLKLDIVPMAKIASLKLAFSDSENYSLFVTPGIIGYWETKQFKGKATLVSASKESWTILPEGKNQTEMIFLSGDLVSFEIPKKLSFAKVLAENVPKVVPGFSQAKEKKYSKAILLFGGAFVSGLGMIYEYNQSVDAINNDREFIPSPDGRVYIVSNVLSTDKYDFHNQRFQGYAAVFSILIAYSLFDSFYVGQVESKSGNTGSAWIKPNIDAVYMSKEKNLYTNSNSNAPFHYSIQIETLF